MNIIGGSNLLNGGGGGKSSKKNKSSNNNNGKYRSNSYTPEKKINLFGAEFSIPSIESNKEKRNYIGRLRKGKRNELSNAKNKEQKIAIKKKYSDEIRKARGGKSWVTEKISDAKEFIDDVKILKSQAENTVVGRVVNQGKDIVSAVASADPEKILKEGVDTYQTVRKINKQLTNKNNPVAAIKPQDGCNCG